MLISMEKLICMTGPPSSRTSIDIMWGGGLVVACTASRAMSANVRAPSI